MFVVLFPTPTPHPPTPAEFHSDPIFVMNTHSFLPPAFRRNGEGNVFTGVCLHLRGGGGYPHLANWGDTPSQVRMGQYPIPGQDGGYPPPPTSRMGYPPPRRGPRSGGGYPQLEQHGVYLLRGGRYASCVHAGGLSCICTNSCHVGRSRICSKNVL